MTGTIKNILLLFLYKIAKKCFGFVSSVLPEIRLQTEASFIP